MHQQQNSYPNVLGLGVEIINAKCVDAEMNMKESFRCSISKGWDSVIFNIINHRNVFSKNRIITMSNQAAWIKEKHGRLVLDEAETPFPGDNEVLVKVELIAFSPIESKIQT